MLTSDELLDCVVISGNQGHLAIIGEAGKYETALELRFGPLEGRVAGDFVFFDARDVRDGLQQLLLRPDLTGEVGIVHSEHGEVEATVVFNQGNGTLSVELATGFAEGECGRLELTTDQAALASAVQDINRIFINPSQ